MALLTSLNTAISGLNAAMAALQTTGHNIANASTPGYSRQRVNLAPRRPQDMVSYQIGRGVDVRNVQRVVDVALESRLREASADLGEIGTRSNMLQRVESLLNAMDDSDLGGQISNFFNSIQDWSGAPDDSSARSTVLQSGQTLSETFHYFSEQVRILREQSNDEISVTVDEVNRLTGEIAELNSSALMAEKGGLEAGAANDIRDRRDLLARELSGLIGSTAHETQTGEMNVMVGSAFLVFGQQAYDLTTNETVVDGLLVETPVFANGAATVSNPGGTLGGLVDSRDTLLRNIQQEMDVLAHSMITQFNRVQSTGQGLERFDFLTSTGSMSDASLPVAIAGTVTSASTRTSINDTSLIGATNITGREVLVLSGENVLEKRVITDFDSVNGTIFFDGELPADMTIRDQFQIGELDFQVTNGSFNFVVTNELSGSQQSFNIEVDLDGIGTDTSLNDIVTAINNALPGSTSIQPDGRLRIDSPTQDVRFHFSNDTSGFVAAMGLNTFFNGSDAESIEVNNALFTNPNLLSQGQSASEGDNTNVLAFATLRAEGVVSGQSFEDFYHAMAGDLGSQSREMQNRTENQALIAQQMDNQRQRVSGVNVDEEAVKMLEYQRAYQASARFISVVDKVLESLFNGI